MPQFSIDQKPPLPLSPRPIVSIGAGNIVRNAHLPAYAKAGFKVAGLFDLDKARAESVARDFGIERVYATLQEAIRNAPERAVFDVAVPASAILQILPHLPDGAGVLIQKPMGETLAEARGILNLCRRKSLTAAINFQLRYAPLVLAARSMIDQGFLGQLVDMEFGATIHMPWHLWPFLETLPRVEILYHSIHFLDLIRFFLGEPSGVYARTLKHPKAMRLASTRSTITLDYGETVSARIVANTLHEFGSRHQASYVKWEGTQGAIKAQLGINLNYPHCEPDWLEYCLLEPGKAPEWRSLPLEGAWLPDAFVGPMASLMRFLEDSSNPLSTSVEDAFRTMAVVEAAYQSSSLGGAPVLYDG
jgi:predicted dehydrogenase